MSWPLWPPVPLRSPPGSFPPVHTWPGWLCSDPQLPGSLDLLGRVACHLSCWRRGGGFRTRWGGTPGREEARAGRQGEGARGQQQVLGITRPSTPAGRAGLKGSLAVCPGEPLASSLSLWGTTSLFLLGGDSGWLGQWASWRSSGTANAPGWGWLPGGPLLSACPPPPHSRRTPRPAPSCCPAEPHSAGRPSRSLPTSARALGGSLFLGHKAPLILCSAPSHVTRWAGRERRRPAQPDSAAG